MAKDPAYSSTPERSVEEDQGYLVPNWDQRGIMDEGYSIQQNFDDASKYVDNEFQAFLQGNTRFSMNSISPGGTYEFGSGVLAVPGIRWAADTDSGFYLPAVADMAAVIGGVEITSWTASGFAIDAMTAGSVLFAGASGLVSQDNTNFFFDDTTNLLKIGGLTASQLVVTDANKYLTSLARADLTGTVNQVSLSASGTGVLAGTAIQLSLPQNIHTGADVTFASLTLTGGLTISSLTPTQVLFAGSVGDISGDAGLTFTAASDSLKVLGFQNVGTTTDANAAGDFAAGLTGATRLFYDQSAASLTFTGTGSAVVLPTTGLLSWSTDLHLRRQAASTLQLSNSTSQQSVYIYRTTDSDTTPVNYERTLVGWDSDIFHLVNIAGGTGAARAMIVGTNSPGGNLTFRVTGTDAWRILSSGGHLVGVTDNTYDIGASGATRPRTLYLGTSINVVAGAVLADTNGITMGDGKNIIVNATTGTKIGTATTQKIAFYNKTPIAQQTGGENVTNSVTDTASTAGTIPDITNGTVYATDYTNLRNALYQLARMLKQDHDALRAWGLLS